MPPHCSPTHIQTNNQRSNVDKTQVPLSRIKGVVSQNGNMLPKTGTKVTFQICGDSQGSSYTAEVIGPAGKSEKLKNWLNVRYLNPEWMSGKTGPVEWSRDVASWDYTTEIDCSEVLTVCRDPLWIAIYSSEYVWVNSEVASRRLQGHQSWVCQFV